MEAFKPLSNYILVDPIKAPSQTESGILLPESSKERPNNGKVLAVGDGQITDRGDKIPMLVKVGDVVTFQKFAGLELKLNGKSYLIMRDTEVFGIIVNE